MELTQREGEFSIAAGLAMIVLGIVWRDSTMAVFGGAFTGMGIRASLRELDVVPEISEEKVCRHCLCHMARSLGILSSMRKGTRDTRL